MHTHTQTPSDAEADVEKKCDTVEIETKVEPVPKSLSLSHLNDTTRSTVPHGPNDTDDANEKRSGDIESAAGSSPELGLDGAGLEGLGDDDAEFSIVAEGEDRTTWFVWILVLCCSISGLLFGAFVFSNLRFLLATSTVTVTVAVAVMSLLSHLFSIMILVWIQFRFVELHVC